MAKNHAAKDQKRAAKQKAKRLAKRSTLLQRTSKDPTVRLQRAGKWPVVQALVGDEIWKKGLGHVLIVRRDSEEGLVYAVFLVDVYCLGVKNAYWRAGTSTEIEDVIRKMEKFETMSATAPSCLAKIVAGAVEFAQSFGFSPHPDYRHAAMLLDGMDPSTCTSEFAFGRDGRPFYIQGPNESLAEAAAITRVVNAAGGHFFMTFSGDDLKELVEIGDEMDQIESLEVDGDPGESV